VTRADVGTRMMSARFDLIGHDSEDEAASLI
jgi:hypothetical protein